MSKFTARSQIDGAERGANRNNPLSMSGTLFRLRRPELPPEAFVPLAMSSLSLSKSLQ
jgi:hypothetical protein